MAPAFVGMVVIWVLALAAHARAPPRRLKDETSTSELRRALEHALTFQHNESSGDGAVSPRGRRSGCTRRFAETTRTVGVRRPLCRGRSQTYGQLTDVVLDTNYRGDVRPCTEVSWAQAVTTSQASRRESFSL